MKPRKTNIGSRSQGGKVQELRVPVKLMTNALANKQVKALRLFLVAKLLHNSRANIGQLIEETDTHPKTGSRLIKSIVANGWAGTDGTYLFPRAWHRIKYNKRGGLCQCNTATLGDPKEFEALCFTWALMKLYRRKGRGTRKGSAEPNSLSLRYVCNALGLKERRCVTLRSAAQRYGFISLIRQYWRVGTSRECGALRKHIQGPNLFAFDKMTLWQQASKVKFNLGQILRDTPKEERGKDPPI